MTRSKFMVSPHLGLTSLHLVKRIMQSLRGHTIRAPGRCQTRRWLIETFKAQIPMGDLGKPEDLGPLAVYLASDASHYMTGAALVIDGGYTLW
jgi:NAD(P)-dependent dehydrogenase (short-subunit alcohol dehydrogenase family)